MQYAQVAWELRISLQILIQFCHVALTYTPADRTSPAPAPQATLHNSRTKNK
jgi:hypothetical protein